MRQIKVRGWDTKRKKMWSAEEMAADQLTLMPDGSGFINVNGVSTRLSQKMPHIIPLQSTGLKDKNGVEIFEGDIVRTKYETLPPLAILWRDGGFYYSPPKKDGKGSLFCVCEFTTESDEVISNIHDNPELLEGVTQ
jgi:hypothetical protein